MEKALNAMPSTRTPVVDLQDCEKEYILKAEMPLLRKKMRK
jgi:HSP20 family molecular chaperone IbpA